MTILSKILGAICMVSFGQNVVAIDSLELWSLNMDMQRSQAEWHRNMSENWKQAREETSRLNAAISSARQEFFAEYPKGKRLAQAQKKFDDILFVKDLNLLQMYLQKSRSRGVDHRWAEAFERWIGPIETTIDGGIPSSASTAFGDWAKAVGDRARAPFDKNSWQAALNASREEYNSYKTLRDRAELVQHCWKVKAPYCSTAGKVKAPTVTHRGALTEISYDLVTGNFVPDLPDLKQGEKIRITLKRLLPGLLSEVEMWRYKNLAPNAISLHCTYKNSDNSFSKLVYWLRSVPEGVTPETMKPYLRTYPGLKMSYMGAAANCPPNYSG